MKNDRYLTGITTTGAPHLGNYVGAIRPAIEASRLPHSQSFYFLADYHALIKCQDPEVIYQSTKEIAATWLALGLDPENAIFYRQTDIPEITELAWILSCVAAKGLLNRSHAYKSAVQSNTDNDRDADYAVTMGLYGYPVLMSADILTFGGNKIPVGKDQIQHVEMARDMAQRFNHIYGEAFVLPEAVIDEKTAVLSGLDGRKMSKSYGNTIPLFCTEKNLKKGINKIKTNLLEPGEKKDMNDSTVFEFWKAFASDDEIEYMKDQFDTGISWGQAKQELFALINDKIGDARERYEDYMKNPSEIEDILQFGASRARKFSQPLVQKVRNLVGIRSLSQ